MKKFLKNKIVGEALTFDDVTLIPNIAKVPACKVKTKAKVTKNISLEIPLISAAMDTVTESKMAIKMAQLGGLGVIHRNLSIKEQVEEIKKVKKAKIGKGAAVSKDKKLLVAAAIGTSGDYLKRVASLIEAGVDIISIDLAHGSTRWAKEAIIEIKKRFQEINIIAGNAADKAGAKYLADAGADSIKVGIGGGSICTTRVITGVGVPSITAILDVKEALSSYRLPIIIDGGLRFSGDLVKAIAAGADCGMCGSLLAGTNETPGKIVKRAGHRYKLYRGMSVKEAMNNRTRDRYYTKKRKKEAHTSQGVSGLVDYKGSAQIILEVFIGGVKAGMENIGVSSIKELQDKGRFYKVSDAGFKEGHSHDIRMVRNEINYSKEK
jgi:IMP dehydrogenase